MIINIGGHIMIKFLFKTREGQFLVLGINFTIIGFILMPVNSLMSQIVFYIAMFFAGFFCSTRRYCTDS